MVTLEKLKWLPIWLIMFALIFTTGAYFYKQSLLTHIGDEYLRQAANKGMFTAEDVENLIDKASRLGFRRDRIDIEISPAAAYEIGVCKSSDELIELKINPNTTAFIANVFNIIAPGGEAIRYNYKRVAKSEEYFD